MPFVNHFHLTCHTLNFSLETLAVNVNENIPRLNMSICASHARPQSNVSRKVALARAISKETTDQQSSSSSSSSAACAREITESKKNERREEKETTEPRKLASLLSISPIDHRHCARWLPKKNHHISTFLFLVDKSARGMPTYIYIYIRAHTHHTGILSSS